MGGDLRHSDFVSVPTGVLVAHDIIQSPRSWIEYSHNVVQYTDIRQKHRGGHFLKLENPTAVVEDLVEFVFQTLGATKENGIEMLEQRRDLAVEKEKVRSSQTSSVVQFIGFSALALLVRSRL